VTKGSELQVAAFENRGVVCIFAIPGEETIFEFFRLVAFIHLSSRETSHPYTVLLPKRARSNSGNAHGYVSESRAFSISSEIFGVRLARLVGYRNIKRIQRH
jgi:hypothetical protein